LNFDSKIYVSGHTGLVGSSLLKRLQSDGYKNIITLKSKELNLLRQKDVEDFFANELPEYVFHAAGKVGGILANSNYPADFLYENCCMQLNVIHSAYICNVKKLLFFGSSCIYPKFCPQPMKEEHLLSSFLEPTNEPYAIAKIAGIKMCQAYNRQYGTNFISVMPTNLYGPGDNYSLLNSHVIPGLIVKMHEAKLENADYVELWGTGRPMREFLYVDDLASAALFLMKKYHESEIINIGSGEELSIFDLASIVKSVVGFEGNILFDNTKPDGTPRKLLDSSRIREMGWRPNMKIFDGIKHAYDSFLRVCFGQDQS
jgi:GDP-L-fucose synthase